MKLIVGLGNPGSKYAGTRHNVGFDVVAALSGRYGVGSIKNQFKAEVQEAVVDQQKFLLVCPQTFMNKSGDSVRAALDFYKLEATEILVICDDFSLPLGRLRFRPQGSAGGQKGLADILRQVGVDSVPRLRFGIGAPPGRWDPADFVLSKFTAAERVDVEIDTARAADGAADWVRHGVEYCMNQYNGA
ncbi:aminoacyl-tRNA hydrolase [Lignipirellula cremea]|uniref:Peptidyl-tRNA hydrolase n=1 Tax=Lignipirellula cremea TaxID=2528010 RepID=A0A518DLN5_9BACT|nr:aminoacyl-tRNA hydrolase [Lignipirellula cremea]QDU92760.1 Peptidyl-tRNA hydrolase [Lignipirellula cremea]